ncbi:sororin [Sceloporus undulatus]|uniref:sororin n=1 Tax=Sceloporus undulatus TaxID=8520 RepID=UPI001C4AA343|nr:sororin [Sceloporus undulatus]
MTSRTRRQLQRLGKVSLAKSRESRTAAVFASLKMALVLLRGATSACWWRHFRPGCGGRFQRWKKGRERRLKQEPRRKGAMTGEGRLRRRRARSAGEAREAPVPTPPRRRSERNAASAARPAAATPGDLALAANKMAESLHPGPRKMKPITLKKIVPRSRQIREAALTPRRSPRISFKEDKENVPLGKGPGALKPPSPQSALVPEAGKDALSPVTDNASVSSPEDERDQAMAKRVRRSYSRLELSVSRSFLEKPMSPGSGLSDTSTPNHGPGKRQTLFGFEKLLVPDGLADVSPVNTNATQRRTATETEAFIEPDTNIPGVLLVKEKRRKKKMPQFNPSELDEWVTQMNAEFEEAEKFDLLVE